MKILKIGGRNLASLGGDFEVNFEQEPLASSGLFAISGPTGAGKSTLLDALCLALYGATPRLLKSGKGAYVLPDVGEDTIGTLDPRSLLRRGTGNASAHVEFMGNDGTRYRAQWDVKRAYGKPDGALQPPRMKLEQLPEQAAIGATNTEVLTEIALRIGLSFEQFTRAVLLAQNEFSAFLKTEENDRGELLETLTGTAVYSEISRLAFERYRAEQDTTRQITLRLADQAPMKEAARVQLELDSAAADAALAGLDARQAALRQQLQWHKDWDRLRQSEALAQALLQTAQDGVTASQERRRHFALVEQAQPGQALAASVYRLETEGAAASVALSEAATALQLAAAQQQTAQAAAVAAAAQWQVAQAALAQAAPALDKAKALDGALAALLPAHQQAASAKAAAEAERAAAQLASAQLEQQHATAVATLDTVTSWLAKHHHWQALAAQWPRWDQLFTQASQLHHQQTALGHSFAQEQQAGEQAARADTTAASALAAASVQRQQLQARRDSAADALRLLNADALQDERATLDVRRTANDEAVRQLSELADADTKLAAAGAALASAQAAAPGLEAAAAQAERSLKAAELACAGDVVQLRTRLEDGQPCPVCGSADHPYQHTDAALRAVFAGLEVQLATCREALQANRDAHAAQSALQASSLAKKAALAPAAARFTQTLDWYRLQAGELLVESTSLVQREQTARAAQSQRDEAQQALDQCMRAHAALAEQASASRSAHERHQAQCKALDERAASLRQQLDEVLASLQGAGQSAQWQSAWHVDPLAWHAARSSEAGQWQAQSQAHASQSAALANLALEMQAASVRAAKAGSAATSARQAFALIDADMQARHAERALLWDGRPASAVEAALGNAIDEAGAALAAQQAASSAAAHTETRLRETQAQTAARLAAIGNELQQAGDALAHWQDQALPGTDRAGLQALLAHGPQWLAGERQALAAIDAAAASAATVLGERHALVEQHGAPADPAQDPAALAGALDAVQAERSAAHTALTAKRLLQAQDDERRGRSQALLADIGRQELVERRWGKLSELIGSADGRKFRNYAQQFTLDVLLGYANSHLAQLAPRYRLDRVLSPGGPSLGLLVRDQDMGDEVRSVNSLSGGESFLVSLALALGLASLSANRVRVESLFIDEGFGSLDSDTLRVAMDALDGLQAMGRKVGVISHVQEMTERIAARIVVAPLGGGMSTVTVQ